MLKSLNQRGIAPLIMILIVLAGLVSATYLIQQQTNLLPQAKEKISSKKSNETTAQKKQKTKQSSSKKAIQAVRAANETLREGLRTKNDQLLIEAGAQTVAASTIAYVELSTEAQSPTQNETREKKKEKLTKSVELLGLAHGQAIIAQKSIQRDGNREKLKTYAENLTSQVNENAPTVEAAFATQDLNQIQTAVEKHLKLAGLEGAAKGQSDFANNTIADEDLTLIDQIKNFLIPPVFAAGEPDRNNNGKGDAQEFAERAGAAFAAAQAEYERALASVLDGKSMEASGYAAAVSNLAQAQSTAAHAAALATAYNALATARTPEALEVAKAYANALATKIDGLPGSGHALDARDLRSAIAASMIAGPAGPLSPEISNAFSPAGLSGLYGNVTQLDAALDIASAIDSAMGSYSVDSFDTGSSGGSFDSSGIGTSDIGSSDTGGSTDSNSSPGE